MARIAGPVGGQITERIDEGTLCRVVSPLPGPLGMDPPLNQTRAINPRSLTEEEAPPVVSVKSASEMSLSNQALTLLKEIEQLRLQPYDDQTGKEITAWVKGATIGYGHLIKTGEWNTYKDGITAPQAHTLLEQDLKPFVNVVRSKITVKIEQQQFDALVILAFNIGPGTDGFAGSSVVKLINDPKAKTDYKNLEEAWKAWIKSQGKVVKGLENRRACEWNIYSQGLYKRW